MSRPSRNSRQRTNGKPESAPRRPSSPALAQVCESPNDWLGTLDIAALNLMCASGLPGSENLNHAKIFDRLDEAARRVDLEIRRHWYRFLASPGTYNDSPGYFCCYMLLQVLQEDFDVRYNPARAVDPSWQDMTKEPDFKDSRDLFIHGILNGQGGTCGSMPVLYVAVGRRLGYPLKLVEARGHLFFRWDDPLGLKRGLPERFNVEGTNRGIHSFPDDYYRTWPQPWTDVERKANLYLRSLTPKEELASFLQTRASCLEDNGHFDEAIQAYRWAVSLVPHDPRPLNTMRRLIWRLQKNVLEMNGAVALRRQAERLTRQQFGLLPSPVPMPPATPPHSTSCRCRNCVQTAQFASMERLTGHSPHCQCTRCRESVGRLPRPPGHPIGCGCFHCLKARSTSSYPSAWHPQ